MRSLMFGQKGERFVSVVNQKKLNIQLDLRRVKTSSIKVVEVSYLTWSTSLSSESVTI